MVTQDHICSRPAAARARYQGGSAVFLLVLLVLVILLSVLVGRSGSRMLEFNQEQAEQVKLADLKKDIVNQSVIRSDYGQYPGKLQWLPDTNLDGNYDGHAETQCINQSNGANPGATAYCFGRWPWLDAQGSSTAVASVSQQKDLMGERPWFAASMNLVAASICNVKFNPDLLNRVYVGYACPAASGALPYPWLTVRDARGNVLSNRVALVLILPGVPVGTQQRGASVPAASQFLDRVTVQSGCSVPCVPGTYSNADGDNDFILGPTGPQAKDTSNYAQPVAFNDHVAFVTIDELMHAVQKRVGQEVAASLRLYHQSSPQGVGGWPTLAPWSVPSVPAAPLVGAPYLPLSSSSDGDGLLPFASWKKNADFLPAPCPLSCAGQDFDYSSSAAFGPMTVFPATGLGWTMLNAPSFSANGTVLPANMSTASGLNGHCVVASNQLQMTLLAPIRAVNPLWQVQCTASQTAGLPPLVVKRLYRLKLQSADADADVVFKPALGGQNWATREVTYPKTLPNQDLGGSVEIWDYNASGGQIGHGTIPAGSAGQVKFVGLPYVPILPLYYQQNSGLSAPANWYAEQEWYRFVRVVSSTSGFKVGGKPGMKVLVLVAGAALPGKSHGLLGLDNYFEGLNTGNANFEAVGQPWSASYNDTLIVVDPAQ